MPRKGATTEVEHDVAQRFHIVTARLLHTKMGVDACITSCPGQILVLAVWNVKVGFGVTVFLCQTKVDDVDLVPSLADAHQEVVGFDVTVDEGLGVNVLDARDELIGEQENSLQGKFAVAEVKEILQAGPQQIEHHGVVVAFGTEPTNEGNANTTRQGLVDASFIFELRVLGLDTFKLDGDFFSRDDVGAQVDITETSTTDLAADAVFVPDT